LVTVVDDRTGKSRKVCTAINFLKGAIEIERHMDGDKPDWERVDHEIIANTARIYHFSNPKALDNIVSRYSDDLLATIRQRCASDTDAELCARLRDDKRRQELIEPGENPDAVTDAIAHVLLERGLFARQADIGGYVIPITRENIQIAQKRRQDFKWKIDDNRVYALSLSKRLPGFTKLSHIFRVKQAMTGDINLLPASLCCDLTRNQPALIDAATWFNPLVASRPQYSWHTFLRTYRDAGMAAARQPWIARWKKRYGGSVELQSFGNTGIEDVSEMPGIRMKWQKAGYKQAPIYELGFYQGDHYVGSVYLDGLTHNALIYNCFDPEEDTSIAAIDSSYHSPSPLMPKSIKDQERLGVHFVPVQGAEDYYSVVSYRGHLH